MIRSRANGAPLVRSRERGAGIRQNSGRSERFASAVHRRDSSASPFDHCAGRSFPRPSAAPLAALNAQDAQTAIRRCWPRTRRHWFRAANGVPAFGRTPARVSGLLQRLVRTVHLPDRSAWYLACCAGRSFPRPSAAPLAALNAQDAQSAIRRSWPRERGAGVRQNAGRSERFASAVHRRDSSASPFDHCGGRSFPRPSAAALAALNPLLSRLRMGRKRFAGRAGIVPKAAGNACRRKTNRDRRVPIAISGPAIRGRRCCGSGYTARLSCATARRCGRGGRPGGRGGARHPGCPRNRGP